MVFESDQTINLTLSAPTGGATLGSPNTSVLTITNDDTAPTFSIDDVTHQEGDTGTTSFVFTVTKTGSTELSSQVDFTTQDVSATTGDNDYVLNAGTLNFSSSDTTKTITVLVNGDVAVEPDETFTVHLSNATNATISDADGTGTITNDDTVTADISVTKSAPASATEGNNFTYTITISNSAT